MVAHYNTNADSLKSAFSDADSSRFSTVQADLTSESNIKEVFDSYKDSPIQVLVVNHATWTYKSESIAEMSTERWNKTISTNLTSVFFVIREFLQRLSADGISISTLDKVSIVLVSSTAGKYGNPGHVDYASAKSGE